MKNRKGQALIVVVIIMAVVMAVFANSLTTGIRSHSLTETEVYQREQALYLAETGVNRMIFNINNGVTYNDGQSISGTVSGIESYESIYHTSDDPGYGGSAYIESIGTVGEFSRKIFVSVQEGGSDEAFKYCLYTKTGGCDGIEDDSYFTNLKYGNEYLYNTVSAETPYPDIAFYTNKDNFDEYIDDETESTPTYDIQSSDLGKVIYIHTDPTATLTVNFSYVSSYLSSHDSFKLSIVTDAENVEITKLYPLWFTGSKSTWEAATNSKDNKIYPIITHLRDGTTKFELTTNNTFLDWTLQLNGFLYTAGAIDMEYVEYQFWNLEWGNYGEIDGEVIEKNPSGKLGGQWGDTHIKYVTDYYTTPPPHFIIPKAKVLPGSFREEY